MRINIRNKKFLIIGLLVLVGVSIVGLSVAYYIGLVVGNRNNSIALHTTEYGNLIVSYPDTNGTINMGTVNLNDDTAGQTLSYMMKFQVQNTGSNYENFNINWINLTNNFCQYRTANYGCSSGTTDYFVGDDLTYALYRCSSTNYNSATTTNVPTNCEKISETTDEAMPLTGSTNQVNTKDYIRINGSSTQYFVLILNLENLETNQNYNLDKNIAAAVNIDRYKVPNIKNTILKDNTAYADNVASPFVSAATGIDFTNISSDTNGKGLYYTANTDYINGSNPIYYFRGNVDNNNIIFAGFCWKIISTTKENGAKIIYNGPVVDGTCPTNTGTTTVLSGTDAYKVSPYGDNTYIGYMYGATAQTTHANTHTNATNSTIKAKIDTWFASNLNLYAQYIDNTYYCNDRTSSTSSASFVSGGGYGTVTTYYGPYVRGLNKLHPTFKCTNPIDQFTLAVANEGTEGFGNNKLTYPIGMITADEIIYAGGIYGTVNNTFYLYNNQNYWTMSPSFYSPANVIILSNAGTLTSSTVYATTNYTRPVITLKSNLLISTGTGTSTNPYIIPVTVSIRTFETAGSQTFTMDPGTYLLEVWGAQGGKYTASSAGVPGLGGYSRGKLTLSETTSVWVYTGGQGTLANTTGGFNGGGSAKSYGGSGGGATDIRIGTDSLYARVIVAGGGGGAGYSSTAGGYGGGTTGGQGGNGTATGGFGGSQTSGGTNNTQGIFGSAQANTANGGGGGGGWYGGSTGTTSNTDSGGGGGSGWIYTQSTYNNWCSGASIICPNWLLNQSYYLTDAYTCAGNGTCSDGGTFYDINGAAATGQLEAGKAKITATAETTTEDNYW